MDNALAISRLGLLVDLSRIGDFSQNLANIATPGYRRQVPVTAEFDARYNDLSFVSGIDPATMTVSDIRSAGIHHTGRPLDLALDGDGFFVVSSADGARFTRRGDFALDGQGRLVDGQGNPVLAGGKPVQVTGSDLTLDTAGNISSGGKPVGRLDIAQFADPSRLAYVGNGLFEAGGELPSRDNGTTPIRQGYLESSNVNPAHEMVGILETSRHIEMTRTVLVAYDEMLDSATNTLAQF